MTRCLTINVAERPAYRNKYAQAAYCCTMPYALRLRRDVASSISSMELPLTRCTSRWRSARSYRFALSVHRSWNDCDAWHDGDGGRLRGCNMMRVGGADIPVCRPTGRQECLPHFMSG